MFFQSYKNNGEKNKENELMIRVCGLYGLRFLKWSAEHDNESKNHAVMCLSP